MNIDKIEEIIRCNHGGAWWGLFHVSDGGHRFLPTGDVLTPHAYEKVQRRFAPVQTAVELTAEDRKRNSIRARADEADRYGR